MSCAAPATRPHPLRVWRERQKPPYTQADFAELVGASRATISRIEAELQSPSAAMVRKIVDATKGKVSAKALIGACPQPRQRQRELTVA